MHEIRMDRRSFLKGMLGISVAVAVLPNLPQVATAEAVSVPTTGTMMREAAKAAKAVYGSLGRVRIADLWFPLDNASFTMFRRHAPLRIYTPGPTPGSYLPVTVQKETPLVESPWQVEIWSPDSRVQSFFAKNGEFEFEFDTRRTSFVGNGFVTEIGSDIRRGEIDGVPALFNITLEGTRRLTRYGEQEAQELDLA